MNIFIHDRRLVASDMFLFHWCHFVLGLQKLNFQMYRVMYFFRTEIDYDTFSKFFIINTFIVTICDYLWLLLFEACFKNRNHHSIKVVCYKTCFMSDGHFDTLRPYENRLNTCW